MNKKQALKIKVGEALLARAEHKQGVGNRADPTAWDRWTWEIGKGPVQVTATLRVVWDADMTIRARVGSRKKQAFISYAVNRRLHPLVECIDRCIQDALHQDVLAEMAELDARYDELMAAECPYEDDDEEHEDLAMSDPAYSERYPYWH